MQINDYLFDPTKKSVANQLVSYGLFGLSLNSLFYVFFLLITYLGLDPKIAATILYGVGATVSFLGNRKWIFAHQGSLSEAGIRFAIAHLLGYLINITMLFALVDNLGFSHQWIQFIAVFVVAGFLFVTFKIFVFRETTSPEET